MKVFKISLFFTFFSLWFVVCGFSSSATMIYSSELKSASAETGLADKTARELYAQNCARCHGADGRAKTELGETFEVPNIADARWQSKHSDAKITRKIIKGGGGMPAFGKKLSPQETASLVAYIRTLKN